MSFFFKKKNSISTSFLFYNSSHFFIGLNWTKGLTTDSWKKIVFFLQRFANITFVWTIHLFYQCSSMYKWGFGDTIFRHFFTKIEYLQFFTLFILLIYSFHTNNINFLNILWKMVSPNPHLYIQHYHSIIK